MADYFAHESAVIDAGVTIGDDTKVWHFCHVAKGARIGVGCSLGQNVYVAGGVVIGDRCRIQNNVSLYDGVCLKDDVFCGPSVVFTNVRYPRANVSRKHLFEKTLVQNNATLGAICTVVCGVTIGEFAFVAAGAVVTNSVTPYAIVAGIPAVQLGWACMCGDRLMELTKSSYRCSHCGRKYSEEQSTLCLVEDEYGGEI